MKETTKKMKDVEIVIRIREVTCFFLLLWLLVYGDLLELSTVSRFCLWASLLGSGVVLIERIIWQIKMPEVAFDITKLLDIKGGILGEIVGTVNSFAIILICKQVCPILLGLLELSRIVMTGKLLIPDTIIIGSVSVYSVYKLYKLLTSKLYEEEKY